MFRSIRYALSMALVAPAMALSALLAPALAQQPPLPSGAYAPPLPAMAPTTPMPDNEQSWREHFAEHRDIRELRQQLRHEHDELEAEHESLRIECINAKGQDHSACQQKWHDLHQRKEALDARIHALHERATQMRAQWAAELPPADH
jgi:hypothetical protein